MHCWQSAVENAGADARRHDRDLLDRNVLGVLAPILKKELGFTTEQYSYVVSVVPDRLFLRSAGRRLSHRPDRPASRLCGRRLRLGRARPPCRRSPPAGSRWPASVRCSGSSEAVAIPTGTKMSTVWFPSQRALDRHRLVQLRLVDRRDDHAAFGDLAVDRATAGAPPFSSPALLGVARLVRLVLALPRSRKSILNYRPKSGRQYIEAGQDAARRQALGRGRCCRSRNFSASSSPAS